MVYTKHCCYGTCNSDSRYADRPDMQGVFFLNFPKPKTQREKCEKWIRRCGRPKEQFNVDLVKKMTFICSKHFVGGMGPTADHPDPIPATACPREVQKFIGAPRKPSATRSVCNPTQTKRKKLDDKLEELVAAETLLAMTSAEITQEFSKSHTVGTQTDPVVFASQVDVTDAGCQTVYDKNGLQTKVETTILRNELNNY